VDQNIVLRKHMFARSGLRSRTRPIWSMLRFQLAAGIVAASTPSLLLAGGDVEFVLSDPNALVTALLSFGALVLAVVLFRRAEAFPGLGVMFNVLWALSLSIFITLIAILALRLDYSRLTLATSLFSVSGCLLLIGFFNRNPAGQVFHLVPSDTTEQLARVPGISWKMLKQPTDWPREDGPIVADLRLDLTDDWERALADFVLSGRQVYHVKQLQEMLTGRVQIEHPSENSFGTLAPSETYAALKRAFDIVFALVLLPFLLPLFATVAVLIKFDSAGPVFFRQTRIGYRGQPFRVIKFRTMVERPADGEECRESAKTLTGDSRITRLGRFLRRSRIDELPQVFNVLRGHMSWIGPRPEAVPLSEWYTAELPYYRYRHVVRPGITGWAQVNQGHVTELDEVLDKLHFDFYYIKHFSAWIDITILVRTILTLLSGSGAR
jgi:lipopolysaccharide/colanic/teichoic acid biosynthesis glycosyltransferase